MCTGKSECHKIVGEETFKGIWDTLRFAHEGTNQVKEANINILIHIYELFKMDEHESVEEMFNRFTVITNDPKSLGNPPSKQHKVRNLLRSLPKLWRSKLTTI